MWIDYYFIPLLLELVLISVLIVILKKGRKQSAYKYCITYLIFLFILFVSTDVGFLLTQMTPNILKNSTYFKLIETINQLFSILEIYIFYSIYNLDCPSKLLSYSKKISLTLIVFVLIYFYNRILKSSTFYDVLDAGQFINLVSFFTLVWGGVAYFVTVYLKNIVWTKHTILCFTLFSYSLISFLSFPLLIFCYKFLYSYYYWRLVGSYHFFILIILAITMCYQLVYRKESEIQYNVFKI